MSCCGQKRRALSTPTRRERGWIAVEYRNPRGGPLQFEGASGHSYVFSAATPIHSVHPRDARGLLRSDDFRMV